MISSQAATREAMLRTAQESEKQSAVAADVEQINDRIVTLLKEDVSPKSVESKPVPEVAAGICAADPEPIAEADAPQRPPEKQESRREEGEVANLEDWLDDFLQEE